MLANLSGGQETKPWIEFDIKLKCSGISQFSHKPCIQFPNQLDQHQLKVLLPFTWTDFIEHSKVNPQHNARYESVLNKEKLPFLMGICPTNFYWTPTECYARVLDTEELL